MKHPSAPRSRVAGSIEAPQRDRPAVDGLVWVTDGDAGIRRQRCGDGFVYLASDGRRVTDSATLQRIRGLAIPPAYEDVWICATSHGHLQATGRDARGRKQYRYHPLWQAGRGDSKFEHLAAFGRVLPRIRARVARDLRGASRGCSLATVLATLVRVLDTTYLRIGNDAYLRSNGSFGLTTLRNRHADVHGSEVRLAFRGKSGQRQEVFIDDRRVAAVVRRCKHLPGQELFQWTDELGRPHRVGSAEVNAYLRAAAGHDEVTAKDFRTWHASVQALDLAGLAGASKTSVLAGVAKALGNTPAVCRKAYVHPAVLAKLDELGTSGDQPAAAARASGVRGLSAAESRLLQLIAPAPRRRAASPGVAPR